MSINCPIPKAFSRAINSSMGWVEWPIVQTVMTPGCPIFSLFPIIAGHFLRLPLILEIDGTAKGGAPFPFQSARGLGGRFKGALRREVDLFSRALPLRHK